MSMTIYTTISGVTDLGLMLEALQAMGLQAWKKEGSERGAEGELAEAWIENRRIGIVRNGKTGQLALKGDSDWRVLRDTAFQNRLRQQYGVAAVREKAKAMNYQISSITTRQDGSIQILATAWG
ncbi:MAG: DUF1257 domain-containing protein [Thermodesulfobacteriota bacterium]